MKTSKQLTEELGNLHSEAKKMQQERYPDEESPYYTTLAIEFGMTQWTAKSAISELFLAEQKIESLESKLKHSIHRQDVVELLAAFSGRSYKEAEEWMSGEGYFEDEIPMEQPTLATVGPIRDVGNPFETAIPY